MTWLVEITGYDPALATTRTFYYSDRGYRSKPTDSPASTHYPPNLQIPLNFERALFSSGMTQGSSSVGIGEVVLVHGTPWPLDELRPIGFDGREMKIKRVEPGAALSTATTFFSGTIAQVEYQWRHVRLLARDRLAELDVPIQPNKYAGNNVLPGGLEGTADDIKGQPKPLVYGHVQRNITPVLVNTSRVIYQYHDGTTAQATTVYDRGVALTKGTNYTSQSDMETSAPSAGQWRDWPGGGYFRLGSLPAGAITADVLEGSTTASRSAAQIVNRMLSDAGITGLDAISVTSLDSKNAAECGVYIDSETTVLDAVQEIMDSIGGYILPTRAGTFEVGRFEAPGTSLKTLKADRILERGEGLQRLPTGDQGRGIPAKLVKLRYARNYTVQLDRDLGGDKTSGTDPVGGLDRRQWLEREWRVSTDTTAQPGHLLAPELILDTALAHKADADTEVARRGGLYTVQRDRYLVPVKSEYVEDLDLGDTITLQLNRFDLSAGKKFVVIGDVANAETGVTELDLWG